MIKEFQILRKLKQLIAPLKRRAYLRRMARAGLLALACILVLLTAKMHFIPSEKGKASYLEQADLFYENGAYGQARIMYKDVLENPSWSAQEKEWAHYQLGNCYRKLGSLPQAICYYETFIRQYPKSRYLPEVKYGLALCYEKAENQDRASQMLRELIREFPGHRIVPKAYFALGEHLKKKDIKAAIAAYQKIIKMYPQSRQAPQAYLRIGDIYLQEKHYSEAIIYYTSLLQKYPQSEEEDRALFNLSRCYLSRNDIDKALPLLSLLVESFPESDLREKALFLIGESLEKKKEYEKAIQIFQEIQRMYPDSPTLTVRARERIAQICLIQKDLDGAIRAYESILKDFPYVRNAEEIYLKLAQTYQDKGDYENAVLTLEEFADYFPTSENIFSVYMTLSECLFKQNLYLEGIKALQKAIGTPFIKEDRIRKAYHLLGEGYLRLGLWDKAKEALFQALPSSYNEERLSIELKIADCYLKKGDIASARKFLLELLSELSKYSPSSGDCERIGDILCAVGEEKKALKIYERINEKKLKIAQRISILYKMANIKESLGDVSSAIKTYKKIIGLKDSSSRKIRENSLFHLADLYYSLGKYRQASSFYQEALKEAKSDEKVSWGLYQIGNCYRRLKDRQKAKQFYQRLNKDFPDTFWADMARTLSELAASGGTDL